MMQLQCQWMREEEQMSSTWAYAGHLTLFHTILVSKSERELGLFSLEEALGRP